jgi:uridine kinase
MIQKSNHERAAGLITAEILDRIINGKIPYVITVAGESGSGKTETGAALYRSILHHGFQSLVLNQDNYFYLAPGPNDAKRKADPAWLGPHAEVNLDLMENNLSDARSGAREITVPWIDYHSGTIIHQKLSLTGIRVIIAEGTYVSLLRQVDTRIFITSTYIDTLPYRILRNRGNEVNDPFVENILVTEHKIIAGHRFLADYLITPEYEVIKCGRN